MPLETLELELEPGEQLVAAFDYQPGGNATPYAFAVTDRALFTCAKKHGFVMANPWYLKRTPLTTVKSVRLRAAFSIGPVALGLFLLIGGIAATLYLFSSSGFREIGSSQYGAVAAILAGLYLLYGSRKKCAIVIETAGGNQSFAPPTTLAAPNKKDIEALQQGFLGACRKVGVHVVEA
jgi:hypothetical protein